MSTEQTGSKLHQLVDLFAATIRAPNDTYYICVTGYATRKELINEINNRFDDPASLAPLFWVAFQKAFVLAVAYVQRGFDDISACDYVNTTKSYCKQVIHMAWLLVKDSFKAVVNEEHMQTLKDYHSKLYAVKGCLDELYAQITEIMSDIRGQIDQMPPYQYNDDLVSWYTLMAAYLMHLFIQLAQGKDQKFDLESKFCHSINGYNLNEMIHTMSGLTHYSLDQKAILKFNNFGNIADPTERLDSISKSFSDIFSKTIIMYLNDDDYMTLVACLTAYVHWGKHLDLETYETTIQTYCSKTKEKAAKVKKDTASFIEAQAQKERLARYHDKLTGGTGPSVLNEGILYFMCCQFLKEIQKIQKREIADNIWLGYLGASVMLTFTKQIGHLNGLINRNLQKAQPRRPRARGSPVPDPDTATPLN